MKNILFATYYFPPYSHPGVPRFLRYARYLPLSGYKPIVLTCSNMRWNDFDHDTYDSQVKGKIDVRALPAPRFEAIGKPVFSRYLLQKLFLRLEKLFLDDRLDWAFGNRKTALTLARENDVHLVLTSGPPQSVHYLGHYLKRKLGIPWVIDFRDPMFNSATPLQQTKASTFADALKRHTVVRLCERAWVRLADAVVTATDRMATDLKEAHPEMAQKIEKISNGYDEDDFTEVEPIRPTTGKFRVVNTGRFWCFSTPADFLAALKLALQREPSMRERLEVVFVGPVDEVCLNMMRQKEFTGIVQPVGLVSHRMAIAYQLGGDASLLILSVTESAGALPVLSGKIFEYLRTGHPILALVPQGEARHFVESNGLGIVVPPRDHAKIADAIVALYKKWALGELGGCAVPKELLARHESRALTAELGVLFDKVLENQRRGNVRVAACRRDSGYCCCG